jgi:hypothetical protein
MNPTALAPAPVEQIADAVLYEGYILYPYRASAPKNGQRWNFGMLYPPAYAAAQQGSDASTMHCECLFRGGDGIRITLRFLQLVTCNGAWQEAVAREVELTAPGVHLFTFPEEQLRDGAVVRRQERVEGAIEVTRLKVDHGWSKVSVHIANSSPYHGANSADFAAREAALRRSMFSTHAILRVPGGEFASLLDPPEELRQLAAGCSNSGLWPVLAGDASRADTMLASPIILYDYPRIAPESPGALFDGTEIDEILSLRILTLTDEEKREMRETDPHARELLERTEALDSEQWMRLHGALRNPRDAPDSKGTR